jgi:hypothetical protein
MLTEDCTERLTKLCAGKVAPGRIGRERQPVPGRTFAEALLAAARSWKLRVVRPA